MDIHLRQPLVLGHLQKGEQVLDVGVYAAVGQQTVQMQAGALGKAVVHGLVVGLVPEEAAVLDGAADAGQILEHHAAAADVGHLTGGQTHVQSAGGQGGVRVFLEQLIQHRRFGQRDGVIVRRRRQAEAVHNDKGGRGLVHAVPPWALSPDWLR